MMARILFIVLAAVIVPVSGIHARPGVERYEYVAIPKGSDDPDRRETSNSTITTTASVIRYEYRRHEKDRMENGWIETDSMGVFRSAFRTLAKSDGRIMEVDSLWTDGERLNVRRFKPSRGTEEMKVFDLPDDKPLAVDASLLLWMRRFPFAEGVSREVYMVDFSQRDVTVTVQQKETETLTVPAGTFECYHLEVVVKVFIFKARIHFWITTDKPHFLVRQEGKRGPFTRSYLTELVRVGDTAE